MKLSNMIGALGVADLAFLSKTVDASRSAAQTSGHLRHHHLHGHGHSHVSVYDNDDDGDSSDYHGNQRGRMYGDNDDDDDRRGVYNSGGKRKQRSYGGTAAESENYGSPANSGATSSADYHVSNGGAGVPATAAAAASATAGTPSNAAPGLNQGAEANAEPSHDAANAYGTSGDVPRDVYAQ